jgi:hypothetical protein
MVRKQREPQQLSSAPRLLGETAVGVCLRRRALDGFPGRDDAAHLRPPFQS